jgi:hypothetical protein
MTGRRFNTIGIASAVMLALCGLAGPAAAKTEIKGAAILDHACGKVAVKQVGYLHTGNFNEANKLTTKEMQEQWKTMPEKDRSMMQSMAKEMTPSAEQFTAALKATGVLVVDGSAATLTTKKTTKDKNGSTTETTTQNFKINGSECLVSR